MIREFNLTLNALGVDDNAVTERVGILKVKFILVKFVYTVLWLTLK